MKIARKEILNRLLCVEPGISKTGPVAQSNCIVLKRGRLYSQSQEISCSIVSELPKEMEGAIRAERLIDLLKALPDDELDFSVDEKVVKIKGKGRVTKIPMESEILMPIDEVERPDGWTELGQEFGDAVDLVHRCTVKGDKNSNFTQECVHIHPKWLEASDNTKMIRYTIDTFVGSSVLVRGTSIKTIAQLGMTKGCETESWLHFRNPIGLRLSVRKFALESYPPLEEFLNLRGRKVEFPKTLQEVAERAGIFAEEEGGIQIRVSKGSMTVEGKCREGEHSEGRKLKYDGPDLAFRIPHKLIAELVKKHNNIEVTDYSLRVNGGKFVYATSLERMDK